MLSFLGRETRRSPGIRTLVQRSIDLPLSCSQVFRQSRLFGTSDLCILGYDDREDMHSSAAGAGGRGGRGGGRAMGLAQHLATAGGAWEAWKSASPVTKRGAFLSLKFSEVLQGAMPCLSVCLSSHHNILKDPLHAGYTAVTPCYSSSHLLSYLVRLLVGEVHTPSLLTTSPEPDLHRGHNPWAYIDQMHSRACTSTYIPLLYLLKEAHKAHTYAI